MSAKIIVVTSGKGGAGKTTVTANLGCKLSVLGARVALADIDFGLNNLDVVMGIENKVVYDIIDVLENRCRAKQALVQDTEYKNLFILPSIHSINKTHISGQQVKMVVEMLSGAFDYILIDCPAGIDTGFHRAVSASKEAVVVVTPSLPSIRDADKVISALNSYKLNAVSLVVNRARGDLILNWEMIDPFEISSILKTKLLGVIPEEDNVFLTGGSGKIIASGGNASLAFKILADNLHTGAQNIYDCTYKYKGFWGSIKRSLRKTV